MAVRAALILAGAAAKGPYAAGVLSQLAKDDRAEILAIAGASSGAINGAVYAAGLRVDKAGEAAELLEQLWVADASWHRILSFKQRKQTLLEALRRFRDFERRQPVRFRVVVASLPGEIVAGRRLFEKSETFHAKDFEDDARLEHMAEICLASAAIPVIFAPRRVAGEGPFWDGGIVNDAPIGWALKDTSIDHIIVVTPDSNVSKPQHYHRFSISRLVDMLLNERLNRDLHEAESFNAELARLDATLDAFEAQLGAAGFRERLATQVRRELSWRTLSFLEIRPSKDLDGNLLDGFFSERLRQRYVQVGRDAAEQKLAGWAPQTLEPQVTESGFPSASGEVPERALA